jgi:hypothetical protein
VGSSQVSTLVPHNGYFLAAFISAKIENQSKLSRDLYVYEISFTSHLGALEFFFLRIIFEIKFKNYVSKVPK